LPALLDEAERTGTEACVVSVGWEFMVTRQFIGSAGEVTGGVAFTRRLSGPASTSTSVVFRLRRAIAIAGLK
jgi:hypothetical protein